MIFLNLVLVCLNSLCNSRDFFQKIPGVHWVHGVWSVKVQLQLLLWTIEKYPNVVCISFDMRVARNFKERRYLGHFVAKILKVTATWFSVVLAIIIFISNTSVLFLLKEQQMKRKLRSQQPEEGVTWNMKYVRTPNIYYKNRSKGG